MTKPIKRTVFVEERRPGGRWRSRMISITAADVYAGRSSGAIAQAERLLDAAQLRAARPGGEAAKSVEIKQLHELREHEVQW